MSCLKSLSTLVVGIGLLSTLATPALAQDTVPQGVTLDVMANGISEVPTEGLDQVILFRMVLDPEAIFALLPELESVALVEVESGELTTVVDGEIDVTPAGSELGTVETMPADEPFTLQEGDSAIFPAGLTGEITNEGSEEASLLIIEVVNTMSVSETESAFPDDITLSLLAGGPAPDLSAGEAMFWLGSFTLEPGAGFAGQAQPGVEVAVGAGGEFTMTSTAGSGLTVMEQLAAAVDAGEETTTAVAAPGDTLTFAEGDAVYFPQGNAVDISNEGGEAATAIYGGVGPAPEE